MIQEKVVISDANILFDLLSVNLMDGFFALPFEVFTTDMVMHEVKTLEWKARLETESRKLRMSIVDFTFEELCEISDLSQQRGAGGLSLPDCWFFIWPKNVKEDCLLETNISDPSLKAGVSLFQAFCIFSTASWRRESFLQKRLRKNWNACSESIPDFLLWSAWIGFPCGEGRNNSRRNAWKHSFL